MLNHSYDRTEKETTDDIRTRFLLAQLLMDAFRDKLTVKDVKSALRNLPRGSDAYDVAYHAAMERIFAQGEGSSKMARKILAWILCAHRPLNNPELLHALAIELGDTRVDEDNILETEQLLTICAGLVTIDEQSDSVRFIHYTTQEYLQRNRQTWLPHAEIEIARSCTAYLSIDGLAVSPCSSTEAHEHRLKEFALLDYAAVYWGPHVNLIMGSDYASASDEIATKALSLLLDNTRLSTLSQVLFMSEREPWSSAPVIEEGKGFFGSHWMARFGLLPLLEQWIEKKHESDQRDASGRTPLSWAVASRQEAAMKLLLDTGRVDVDSRDNDGRTPLSYAAWDGQGLYYTAWDGQEAAMKLLLDTGKVDVDSKDNDGRTALSYAALNETEVAMKLLLDTDKVDIDSKDKDGRTPLSWATRYGREAAMKLLVDTGKVDVDSKDNNGLTPLSWAAWHGQEAAMKLLLGTGRVDVDSRDNDGRTPLSYAVSGGQEVAMKLLLDTGRVDVDSKDNNGLTPLSWAAWHGQEAAMKLLLDTGKVDVDSKDKYGRTPLSWAASRGQEAAMKLLLDTGKVDIDSKDKYGRTLLSWAAQRGHMNTATLLLDKMVVHTPVGVTKTQGNEEVVGPLSLQSTPYCDMDGLGRTPSMWAALRGHFSLIQSLWPSQLSTSRLTNIWKDSLGLSFLHLFAIGNCAQGISLVLRAGCNINEADSQGWTPLHWAAYFDHKEVLHLLIDHGADKTLENSTGQTPYKISLFIGTEQLDGLLESPLTQDNENTLMAAREFNAFCDSCQRVSLLRLSDSHPFESSANLLKTLVGYRYHCRSCHDFDLCLRCILDVDKIHSQHQFDREERLI
jgi:ankyrin repeat protein